MVRIFTIKVPVTSDRFILPTTVIGTQPKHANGIEYKNTV